MAEIGCSSLLSLLLASSDVATAVALLVADIRTRDDGMGMSAVVFAQIKRKLLAWLSVILAHVEYGIIGRCINEVERRPVGGVGRAGTAWTGLADAESFFGADFGADRGIVAVSIGGNAFAFKLVAGWGVPVDTAFAGGCYQIRQADADWVCVAYVRALGFTIAW